MRQYQYVGPEHIRAAAVAGETGSEICSVVDLARWLAAHASERDGASVPATFVISTAGTLRIASRRSEHVACAAGRSVLSAGEMFFDGSRVVAVSNLSTGYCPEPESWPAVAAALEHAGVPHPPRFTSHFVFRRCSACGERNLVKDAYFVCAICDADLPAAWNFA